MGDSLEATAVLPDVAQAPVEKVVAYIRYRIYDSMQEPLPYIWWERPVLRIRIHVFLGLLDLDPLVRGMDPDPSLIKQT